jgi:hypothetical protein
MSQTQPPSASLPCVVQLGFSGSRDLWGDVRCGDKQIAEWDEIVVTYLAKRIAEIELPAGRFFVGISQVACGADMLFSRACAAQPGLIPPKLAIPQRIFLPQHRSEFLNATDSDGQPDFTKCQKAQAEAILDSEQVIQEYVASHSPDRKARFEEANTAILRFSDIVIVLLRKDAVGKAGGAQSFLDQAIKREIPALEIRVGLYDGQPEFEERWHPADAYEKFRRHAPSLPKELGGIAFPALGALPNVKQFCDAVKRFGSTAAEGHQKRFQFAAAWVIGAHIAATVVAGMALWLHYLREKYPFVEAIVAILLACEVVFLAFGLRWHRELHHGRAAQLWALSRVVAELGRSVQAAGDRHLYLEHLFRLQLPKRFRHLLRTLNVLHLRSTRPGRHSAWQSQRDHYLWARFHSREDGQIPYYQKQLRKDERLLRRTGFVFANCSIAAIVFTSLKFLTVILVMFEWPKWLMDWRDPLPPFLGMLAIILPVLAVASLSWTAALDCAARIATFRDTLLFLQHQQRLVENAVSGEDFDYLVRETELTLLNETAAWFARRSSITVT